MTVAIAISRRIQEVDIHRLTRAQGIVRTFTNLHLARTIVSEISRQMVLQTVGRGCRGKQAKAKLHGAG